MIEIEIASGRVRGYLEAGVHTFKGIPYGASTAGAARFLPPRPVAPWSGVREALAYGPDAPQSGRQPSAATQNNLALEPDEDCLVMNVWSPGLDDGARRPVLFWCHGGGFISGSASGDMYDGQHLARRGNVVVVSFNHRLGVLGFLPLDELDPEARGTANTGMLDVLLALEWVRDNVSRFGGDPANVTIFGESGGGRKVSALLAMPRAAGLFRQAIIESGPAVFLNEPEAVRALTARFLDELGVTGPPLRALQALPVETLLKAQAALMREYGMRSPGLAQTFAPVVDGTLLPTHPFDPEAPAISDDVPVIVGFNRTEATLFLGRDPALRSLDEAGLLQRIERLCGERAPAMIETYRKANPGASCSDLLAYILTGNMRYPLDSAVLAERKAARGGAPAYLYTLTWQTPAARGALRTPHALELPFVFDNVEASRRFVGPPPEPEHMAEIMSDTWIRFARTGSPDNPRIPSWPAYTAERREQMVFDLPPRVEADFLAAEREAWSPVFYPDGSRVHT